MPDAHLPAPINPIVRQILDGQLRHLFTIAGPAAIAHGIATQGQVDSRLPAAADYITGTLFIIGPMTWSAASKWVAAKDWGKRRPRWRPEAMRRTTVLARDSLGEMFDQDAGAGTMLRITTNLPAGEDNAFYMDVMNPRPQSDDAIIFEIAVPLHHEVEWNDRRYRQHGCGFDWIGPAPRYRARLHT